VIRACPKNNLKAANKRAMQLLRSENHASSSEQEGIDRPGTRPEHSERNAHCGQQD
jgi:hypothetical protein